MVKYCIRDLTPYQNHAKIINGAILVDHDNTTSINTVETLPNEYQLEQNYPNPFNPGTKIKFSIPEQGFTSLKVYNSIGAEIETLVNKELESGQYEFNYNANSLSSGVYFYKLQRGNKIITKKMILLK